MQIFRDIILIYFNALQSEMQLFLGIVILPALRAQKS